MTAPDFDVIVVGSGPSGAQASTELVRQGFKVGLIDIGNVDTTYGPLIPDKPFSEIRKHDPNQRTYFLGNDIGGFFGRQAKAGTHLTPPREHMIRAADELLPIDSGTFFPIQSTSSGGLATSWGAQCFTMEDFELRKIGLPPTEMERWYSEVARDIGISGSTEDDVAPFIANVSPIQPPLDLDDNARSIYSRYQRVRTRCLSDQFYLGQSLLAVLSRPLGERAANPYHDLDFWSDKSKSVYRPAYTLSTLTRSDNFINLSRRVVERFEQKPSGVTVLCRALGTGELEEISCRRLVLAAGAINSARLALRSLRGYGTRVPLLCNPNLWVASINQAMLGREARDRRYSLAQLQALLRNDRDPEDYVCAQFYSYRSLLIFRLLKDLPLPPQLGVLFARLMLTSFTLVNVHFSERPSSLRWLELRGNESSDVLKSEYAHSDSESQSMRRDERRFLRQLVRLRCIPLHVSRPAYGASIHYAGTLPYSEAERPFTCDSRGRLRGTSRVYVSDGSTWGFLPSKGLTFTLMANARRIAHLVGRDLNEERG